MQIHTPEAARAYLLKSFLTGPSSPDGEEVRQDKGVTEGKVKAAKARHKTQRELDAERHENLGLLLGALRLVLDSWAGHLAPAELDRRAWGWYLAVRPAVDVGPSGWGAKGALKLNDILALRRKGD